MARRAGTVSNSSKADTQGGSEPSDSGEEVTRCICGNDEFVTTSRTRALNASPGLYVQCERCNVWQHGFCMGFAAEKDIPNEYYCELCEPSFHRISHRHGLLMSRYRPFKPNQDQTPTESPMKPPSPELQQQHQPSQLQLEIPVEEKLPNELSEIENDENLEEPASSDVDPKSPTESTSINATIPTTAAATTTPIKEETNDHDDSREPVSGGVDDVSIEHSTPYKSDEDNGLDHHISLKNEIRERSTESKDITASSGEAKKRSKRTQQSNNDSENGVNGARFRKRRSREEEILQRVLEESAREAREAEARRLSLEDTPNDKESSMNGEYVNGGTALEDDPADGATKQTRTKRTRGSAATPLSTQKKRDVLRNGTTGSTTRGGRPGRGGRRGNSRAASNGSEDASHPTSYSRRTANGVKKCKPRIPSPKTSFDEMRRRVASILEFSSRTQDELAEELQHGIGCLQRTVNNGKYDVPLKNLTNESNRNFANLEKLTSKLLKWEENYGIKESP